MASSLRTKLRIAGSVLFATGFFDAIAGRFLFEPRARRFDAPADENSSPWRDLSGAVHIHSTYSDGAGDIPAVMEAAKEAGVDFVLLTDHNTQQPLRDGWEARYPDKPLLLIGTEVTVEHGAFLLALDMPPEWEPTKHQKPQVAIDEVNERGGLPLVSLPFDVKHPWRDWEATGYEGLEVVNVSTIARRHINLLSLAWLLTVNKLWGTMAVLQALLTRPDQAMQRWDALTAGAKRRMVGIGALDAHALMKIGKKKHPIPSYADSFRTSTTHVLIPRDVADSGTPQARRRAIYEALREGRCYIAYDCLGDPTGFTFEATKRSRDGDSGTVESASVSAFAPMGECVTRGGNESGHLTARAGNAIGGRVLLRLLRDGRPVAAGTRGRLEFTAPEPGAYRIEAYRYTVRLGPFYLNARPWVFTNPVYIV